MVRCTGQATPVRFTPHAVHEDEEDTTSWRSRFVRFGLEVAPAESAALVMRLGNGECLVLKMLKM
ncbi:hypothetical protein GN244_ATG16610 [Phytophthora infestans]|uniref:Uncharacterized protein n=1 Tax=Phytophthora infestans TaxID=4787 RepID=A0A833STN7_PHYIN|nr:hypothetical protein GN244_ATG16610 [Phytophthora infestans]